MSTILMFSSSISFFSPFHRFALRPTKLISFRDRAHRTQPKSLFSFAVGARNRKKYEEKGLWGEDEKKSTATRNAKNSETARVAHSNYAVCGMRSLALLRVAHMEINIHLLFLLHPLSRNVNSFNRADMAVYTYGTRPHYFNVKNRHVADSSAPIIFFGFDECLECYFCFFFWTLTVNNAPWLWHIHN